MPEASLGVITAADNETNLVRVTLQPSGFETGWLPCSVAPVEQLLGAECQIVPCGTYGQSLVTPVSSPLPRKGIIVSVQPVTVRAGGRDHQCETIMSLGAEQIGATVLLTPVADGGYVVTGVIQ